jgi:hypothetical protein
VLAGAWGTLIFAPLAFWVHPLWAIAWAVAAGSFLASTPLFRSMALRRWFYGPLSVIAYLGIHCIATLAMAAVASHYLKNGFGSCVPAPVRRKINQKVAEPAEPIPLGTVNVSSVAGNVLPRSDVAKSIG